MSSIGRIRAKPREGQMPNGGIRIYYGTASFGQWDGSRYIYIYRGRTYRVARLICETFNGEPKQKQVCMHLDEDSTNNFPVNLKWGTQKENLNAPGFLEYCRKRKPPTIVHRERMKVAI